MSVFSTKCSGVKTTVNAANVEFVRNVDGKGEIHLVSGSVLATDVGYDSVRRNLDKATSGSDEQEAE